MTERGKALDQLRSIKYDVSVSRDVRDAAGKCLYKLLGGIAPDADSMAVVTAWIGKQQQQDRYGK